MKKRNLVRQRRVWRKALTGIALIAVLSLEMLLVGAISRDVLRPVAGQRMSVDPGLCFGGR